MRRPTIPSFPAVRHLLPFSRPASRERRLPAVVVGAMVLGFVGVVTPLGTASQSATAAVAGCPEPAAGAVYRTPSSSIKAVALTIDDGPSGAWTPRILDILKANGVQATFFLIGENVRQNPGLVARTVAEGHQIGNHTDTHPTMTSLSAGQQAQQMDAAQSSIVAAAGVQPCFFRAPGGSFSPTTLALARERGMSLIGWSNDTLDWDAPLSVSPSYQAGIVDRAINPAYKNPIVLLHDGSPGNYRQNTVDSLQRIIDSYRSRGYTFTDPVGRPGHIGDPVGYLDSVSSPAPGQVRVVGWSFDPSAPTEPVAVHVYVNGAGYAGSTGVARPDVRAVFPQASGNQGFDLTWPAAGGLDTVCVYAINIGPGTTNPALGCAEISVD